MSEIIELSIPLTPLTTQLAIVEVLDKFTSLEKELEKRKFQYQYYRDKLLTFTEKEREWRVNVVDVIMSFKSGLNPRQNFKLNEKCADCYYCTVKEITTGK